MPPQRPPIIAAPHCGSGRSLFTGMPQRNLNVVSPAFMYSCSASAGTNTTSPGLQVVPAAVHEHPSPPFDHEVLVFVAMAVMRRMPSRADLDHAQRVDGRAVVLVVDQPAHAWCREPALR